MTDWDVAVQAVWFLAVCGVLGLLWCIYLLEQRVHKLEHEIYVRGQGWRKAE